MSSLPLNLPASYHPLRIIAPLHFLSLSCFQALYSHLAPVNTSPINIMLLAPPPLQALQPVPFIRTSAGPSLASRPLSLWLSVPGRGHPYPTSASFASNHVSGHHPPRLDLVHLLWAVRASYT